MKNTIKVLMAKPGLDGHDVGAKVVVQGLKASGFEVVYLGLRQTPERIAEAAKEQNVDVIGISVLSGAHMTICGRLGELLTANGLKDKFWMVGGNIPLNDRDKLRDLGFDGVFPTGTPLDEICNKIKEKLE
ncbi:MAG: cobalamin B12-binding domain-containing protein [SAR324 cluster bacterium]|jgi:methylmalonyl-CoA mutase C-terminal domain/subunit|uniref:B12-binding domain-containing protein n=1 Tax=marine metagenome TaxID=408172 RepID=A0A381S902_9ZZZZ|nr:cobalamin B12-binding domain-containing protein [SAR324 cluster bacterium]|tara:strand:- start:449 stop:841 length:393 start_codon:yes stop_codon:yes gene_type:complete